MATITKGFKVILNMADGESITVLTDYEPSLEDSVIKFRLEDDDKGMLYRQVRMGSFHSMKVYIIC